MGFESLVGDFLALQLLDDVHGNAPAVSARPVRSGRQDFGILL